MTKRCTVHGELVETDLPLCPDHMCPLEPAAQPSSETQEFVPGRVGQPSSPGAQEWEPWSTATCWHCHTPVPDRSNTVCLVNGCRRSLIPPSLHIHFPGGEVELAVGASAELGRHGSHGRVFAGAPNVSREHAVVGMDDGGQAWVVPRRTPNGTFVNDTEIPESIRHRMLSGDTLRFARDVEGTVRLYARSPTT